MPSLLVRNLDDHIIDRLKANAKHHGRSLQKEVKAILTETVAFLTTEAAAVSAGWRKSLRNRKMGDSVDLVREDRNR